MIHILIGHRGTGKTTFLGRVQSYYDHLNINAQIFDLDSEISKSTGRTISDLFSEQGETAFRRIENEVFLKLISSVRNSSAQIFIAVGAGFNAELPPGVEVIWLRRKTDGDGRIFTDRPRLNTQVDVLSEFQERFQIREERFARLFHKEIMLQEGTESLNAWEPICLGLRPAQLGLSITLLPIHMENPLRLENFIQDCLQVGVQYIELRDDLLSTQNILDLVQEIPRDKILLSFRSDESAPELLSLRMSVATDWALELGEPPFYPAYLSLHQRLEGETVEQAARRLTSAKAENYKLAIEINSFDELAAGHKFLLSNPEKNSFLPCSADGRWHWYRLLQKGKMKLNFFRFGFGSSPDQPTLCEVLEVPKVTGTFAAVLGFPVKHSRTPAEQHSFFAPLNMPVFAIAMSEEECTVLNVSFLQKLGLRAAAVTSPLKEKVFSICDQVDKRAEDLGSVNTIVFNSGQGLWVGTNTDVLGLEKVFQSFELPNSMAVWGGGGTRTTLRKLFPNARFFSARYGDELWIEKKLEAIQPDPELLIWAVPRARQGQTQKPPAHWRPEVVFDLNYTEDSPGRAYALETGAKYISGLAFFKAQAKAQRDFWLRTEAIT